MQHHAGSKLTTSGPGAVGTAAMAGVVFSGRQAIELGEKQHGVDAAVAAHLARRLQAGADGRARGVAEDAAAVVVVELDAAHPRRFAGRYLMGCG